MNDGLHRDEILAGFPELQNAVAELLAAAETSAGNSTAEIAEGSQSSRSTASLDRANAMPTTARGKPLLRNIKGDLAIGSVYAG